MAERRRWTPSMVKFWLLFAGQREAIAVPKTPTSASLKNSSWHLLSFQAILDTETAGVAMC